MFILISYLLISYGVGLHIQIRNYRDTGVFMVADLLMFLLAPFSVVPIASVYMLSSIIQLDKVLLKKKED